jgi:hypothetical protein
MCIKLSTVVKKRKIVEKYFLYTRKNVDDAASDMVYFESTVKIGYD